MSKLGFHVSLGKHGDLGKLLKRCAEEGSPVPVIFTVDQDVWPDVEQFSPQTVVIFRHQPRDPQNPTSKGLDAPLGTYHDDPVNSARDWMNLIMPVWAKNKAHFYAPINEQDAGDLAGYAWLNTFTLECMRIAETNNLKLALYAFSSGNPRDGETDLDRSTLEDKWRELLPSLQQAKANKHLLLLHEYGFGFKLLRASAPNLALRYRRSYAFLRQFNADPPLVISEASADAGGFKGVGMDAWLDDVQWYDSELTKDREVIGCCLYQLGGKENFVDVLPRLGEYIRTHPTSGELPHVTQQASADDTTVPPNITLTDSVGSGWTLGDNDGAGRRTLRDGVQFAGGQGVELLFHNRKVFTRNSRNEWFVATTTEWQSVPGDPRSQSLSSGQAEGGAVSAPQSVGIAPVVTVSGQAFVFGVHGRAEGGDLSARELSIMRQVASRVTGYKFLTGHSRSHYNSIINDVRIPAANCLTRLFMDMKGHAEPPTSAKFVEDMVGAIQDAWSFGVRWYEVHNEPNLFQEWKASWGGATAFVKWAKEVIDRLRSRPEWEGIQIVSPGLSPHGDDSDGQHTDTWIRVFETEGLFAACDAVGTHAYWGKREEVLDPLNGLNFDRYFAHTDKPIWVTEFSNNQAIDLDVEKGKQYRDYLNHLSQNESRVKRAYCFVLSGGNFDKSKETWVRSDLATDIPGGVMLSI
jgi:hypothetical protein